MRSTPEGWRLLLASNNEHKREELARILEGHRILTPRELGLVFDHEEGGESFSHNALEKALALLELASGRVEIDAVVADDSGLCVDALGGRPGVRSNRYGSVGGRLLDAAEKNALLLRELEGTLDRRASFVCALAIALDQDRFFLVQEVLRGAIGRRPAGAGGFGYDPVFELPGLGKTVAELGAREKDALSHRGRAARRMRALLENLTREEKEGLVEGKL